jgi:erythromycin esterase-like protein
VPALTELADLHTLADAARHAAPLLIPADAEAEAAMNVSLDSTGLLLLGEVHGVRQTPRVLAALIELLDVRALALEWPAPLTSTVEAHRRTGVLDEHELLWLGDGRLTAGHLALLRDLADRRPALEWLAFDTWTIPPDLPGESLWTARDHAMARHILAHTSAAGRTLVVAGNAHTPTARTRLGIPMGAWLARERRGLRSVQINYGPGAVYNMASKPLASSGRPTSYRVRLDDDRLLLDHPGPEEADVPHRPARPTRPAPGVAPC